MKTKIMVLLLALALVLVGCASKSDYVMTPEAPVAVERELVEHAADEKAAGGASNTSGNGNAATVAQDLPKMIIYNGEISLVVKNSTAAQEEVTQMVEALEGYVSNSSSYAYSGGLLRINLTLRMPAEHFNAAMAKLRAMAMEVTQETIGTQDVTQEYVDLESRLRALEAKADRLEELMDQAEDTEAVLAVYQELSQTQQEIEQTKGRMQYLERSAAMATINVYLTPDELSQPVEIAGWRPGGVAKVAFETLIRVFQWLINALLYIAILIVPVVLFLAVVFYLFTRLLGLLFKRRRKQVIPPPAVPEDEA